MKADDGYASCSACLDRLRRTLRDISEGWAKLDATPNSGGQHGGRGAPGFGSKPPANLSVVVMRDRRSLPYEVSHDAVQYVWDPDADHTLRPDQHGPRRGEYVERREVWYGRDGRPHAEQAHALISIPATVAGICAGIAGMRDLTPPPGAVPALIRWLDGQLDWLTRQPWCAEPVAELNRLAVQIRGVHEPRRRIGSCPNVLDDGPTTRVCEAPLYAPVRGDAISCRTCGRVWQRADWLRLGSILRDAA